MFNNQTIIRMLSIGFLLSAMTFFVFGCSGNDGDDDDAADDDSVDDDQSPDDTGSDADDTITDDDVDDSMSDDDIDDTDDDTHSDDSSDDTISDDTVDDDAAETITELIDGGAPGHNGTSIDLDPDGNVVTAAVRGRDLKIYTYDGTIDEEIIAHNASYPTLRITDDGVFHVLYFGGEPNGLILAEKISGVWHEVILKDQGIIGDRGKLETAADGTLHVVYHDMNNGAIKHAVRVSDIWTTETVNAADSSPYNLSFALDPNGKVHVLFVQTLAPSSPRLMYATDATGVYVSVQAYAYYFDAPNWFSEITSDPDGNIHIAYTAQEIVSEPTNPYCMVYYRTNASGSWTNENISSFDGYCTYGDLAAFGSDEVTIIVGFPGSLRKYNYDAGGWSTEGVIFDFNLHFGPTSMKASADGTAHIAQYLYSYNDQSQQAGLVYFENTTGDWIQTDIDRPTEIRTDVQIGMASDADGYVHLCYIGKENANLIYATNESGQWQKEVVETYACSCALDVASDGTVDIAYIKSALVDDPAMHYAEGNFGSWTIETVASAEANLYELYSIATDSDGHAHIAYFDTSKHVHYASNSAGAWNDEDLGSGGDSGPAILVDDQNHVHIAYGGAAAIKYVTNASGSWVTETADDQDLSEYPDCRMVLDPDGNPCIISGQGNLRFTWKSGLGLWYHQDIEHDDDVFYQVSFPTLWLTENSEGTLFVSYSLFSIYGQTLAMKAKRYGEYSWNKFPFDPVADVGAWIVGDVDPQGTFHFAFVGERGIFYTKATLY